MTHWRLAKSLETLRAQIDALAPHRDKRWDGSVGDAAHAARKTSDHNPDAHGVVHAIDITNDPKGGCSAGDIAAALIEHRDARLAYVIWNARIFSSTVHPWRWRMYSGIDSHSHHVHISVRPEHADDETAWNLA